MWLRSIQIQIVLLFVSCSLIDSRTLSGRLLGWYLRLKMTFGVPMHLKVGISSGLRFLELARACGIACRRL